MNQTTVAILELVPEFLRAIASAPASSSFLTPSVDALLLAGAAFIERGDEAANELQALTDQITAMITANRDPNAQEWETLKARSDAAHRVIQGASETPIADPLGNA